MSMFSRFTSGLRGLFTKASAERDLDDEVNHYIAESTAARIAKGMSPADADRAARAEVGSMTSTKEPARSWGWDAMLDTLVQDTRYAARRLRKSPGFTIAAALSLALGIGANTAIFSMVNATLIKRMPVERSEELVTVTTPGGSGVYSYPGFDGIRAASGSVLTGMVGFAGINVSLNQGEATDLVSGAIVTGNYFQVLGVRPAKGRLLQPTDDVTPGAHPVAVISAALWQRRFGSREDIVGQDIRLNSQPFTIVGVVPAGFNGTQPNIVRDVYVPMMMQAWMRPPRAGYSGEQNPDLLQVRTNSWIFGLGRLKPGVSLEQAATVLTSAARAMGHWTTQRDTLPKFTVARLDDGPPGQRAQLVSVARLLTAVVLAVLIIACANVANLLLSRASARRKEIAVRLSIGASRGRLVRQLLTESVLLSALGGALGLGLAWAAIRAVRASPPPAGALPVVLDFAVDWRVMLFTLGLSVLTGVVFGLVPALRASRPDLVPALKDQASEAVDRRRLFNARNGLVVAQVGLSLVLLIASGLFIRSLERTRALEPGFDSDQLLTVPLNIQLLRYTRDQGQAFYRDVVQRVEAVPGVEKATIARWIPFSGGGSIASLRIEGQESDAPQFASEGGGFATDNPAIVLNNIVGPGFFETMGIKVIKGRQFEPTDGDGAPGVVIVTEQFARRHFGTEDPIGKRISLNGPLQGAGLSIVGVAKDSKYATLDENTTRLVYIPAAQSYVNGMTLIVRAKGDPAGIAAAVGREVSSLDRSLPVAGARTYQEWIGLSIYAARAGALLLTSFGGLALLLAAVGLYGVLAYAVSRRTREFGLRMALGARARDVLSQVLSEGMGLVAAGIVGGLIAALSVTRLLGRFLYGVSTTDVATFAWTPAVLLAVALLACLIPAWRATKVDPIKALKQD